jgi:uncharacterized protein (DUF433 family)
MEMAVTFDIGQFLDSDPEHMGGRPFVRGRRVSVQQLGACYSDGMTADQIVREFSLTPAQVHAALAYYLANREAIDADIDEQDRKTATIAAESSGGRGPA